MKEAVIVSTARTPIGKAYRGGFNNLQAPTMGAHAIRAAVERAGTSGMNIGRNAALRAGLPVSVSGMTIDRQCSSGLMAVATAAKQVMYDGMDVVVGGGLDSISLVQNEHMNSHRLVDNELVGVQKDIYMPMLQTAEVVAARYGIARDAMDEYGLQSQERTAAAYAAGRYDAELTPVTCDRIVYDKATGEQSTAEYRPRICCAKALKTARTHGQ